MRQYASREQSGTMMQSQRGKEPLDNVIDRVMAIAQRVVGAEGRIKNLEATIKAQDAKIEKLELKIENIGLKASGQEFKKPTTTRKTTPKTTN